MDPDRSADETHTAHSVDDLGGPPEGASQWGEFRLLGELGHGGYGRVCRAWDATLHREVALKIIRAPNTALGDAVLREGRMLARIHHPNVVSVYGAQQVGNEVGLWMELIQGRHLAEVVRLEGPMSPEVATLTGISLCQALAAVHAAGLLHRDIKAHNVMRESGGRIVLMDFGAGREARHPRDSAPEEVTGTPSYMAPELFTGHSASPASDLYSVGVLLFYLVTGKYPVDGRTLADVAAAHARGHRRLLTDIRPDTPRNFVKVVERALAASPAARIASAGAMINELSEALPPRPLLLAAPPAARRTHYLLGALSVVAGVFLATAGIGAVTSRLFNAAVGRADFTNESIGDWLYWGAVASVAPLVLFAFTLVGVSLLTVFTRLVVGLSTVARGWDVALRTRGLAFAHRHHLTDPTTLSSYALFVSTAILVGALLWEAPLLDALFGVFPNISSAPVEVMAWLSPNRAPDHEAYRKLFIGVAIGCLFIWYPVIRLAVARREWPHRGLVAGGVSVLVLAVLSLDFPYRLLYHNDFEVATWRGASCYILGARGDDALLFCPEFQPPRDRTVRSDDPQLERTGVRESLFTRFATATRSQP